MKLGGRFPPSFFLHFQRAWRVVLAGIAGLLLVVAFYGSLAPAVRAMKVSPTVALRYD
jgi:ABC-type lipoprotein release transport system permease subunit